jgi:hypothetical protein
METINQVMMLIDQITEQVADIKESLDVLEMKFADFDKMMEVMLMKVTEFKLFKNDVKQSESKFDCT